MSKFDFKKEYKELYLPKTTPSVIDVPEMKFISVDGCGNPGEAGGEFQRAVELLYSIAYTVKMLPKSGNTPNGYFEYVVPPLEGLWWLNEGADYTDKQRYCWTAMIRQPEFVTEEVFEYAVKTVKDKKPQLDILKAKLSVFKEGLCVQCMHVGRYEDEPETIEKMKSFMEKNSLVCGLSEKRRHHEIYLSDPAKTDADKLKTVLRYPVQRQA